MTLKQGEFVKKNATQTKSNSSISQKFTSLNVPSHKLPPLRRDANTNTNSFQQADPAGKSGKEEINSMIDDRHRRRGEEL